MKSPAVVLLIAAASFACAGSGDRARSDGAARSAETHGGKRVSYEVLFIDVMSAHHQQAIELARLARSRAVHAPLQAFAETLEREQTRELAELRHARALHHADAPTAVHPTLDQLATEDLTKLQSAEGDDFDRQFIDLMISHRRSALLMASDALNHKLTPELRAVVQSMIDDAADASPLTGWRAAWFAEHDV